MTSKAQGLVFGVWPCPATSQGVCLDTALIAGNFGELVYTVHNVGVRYPAHRHPPKELGIHIEGVELSNSCVLPST